MVSRARRRVLFSAFCSLRSMAHFTSASSFWFQTAWRENYRRRASGFDGHADGAVAGEHDDLGVGPAFFDLRQQFQAVGVRQLHVEQHHVGLGWVKASAAPRRCWPDDFVKSSSTEASRFRRSASSSTIRILAFMFCVSVRTFQQTGENRPMFGVSSGQSFRMKLHTQQKRHRRPASVLIPSFNYSIPGSRHRHQRSAGSKTPDDANCSHLKSASARYWPVTSPMSTHFMH